MKIIVMFRMLKTLATLVAIPALSVVIFLLLMIWICKMVKNHVEVGQPFKEHKPTPNRRSNRKLSLPLRLAVIAMTLGSPVRCFPVKENQTNQTRNLLETINNNPSDTTLSPVENNFALDLAERFARVFNFRIKEEAELWNRTEITVIGNTLAPEFKSTNPQQFITTKTPLPESTMYIPISFRKGKETFNNLMIITFCCVTMIYCISTIFNCCKRRNCIQ
jgi:hypothetical protein